MRTSNFTKMMSVFVLFKWIHHFCNLCFHLTNLFLVVCFQDCLCKKVLHGSFKMFLESLYFWKYKTVKSFKLNFLQNSPLVRLYIAASDCRKMLETFLGAISQKPFQLLVMTVAPQKCRPLNADFSQGNIKISWLQVRRVWGDTPVLLHCSLLRNPWPKLTSVLEHCCEGETNCWFSIFGGISSWLHPKARKDVSVNFFIHSFTFRDELLMDNTLADRYSCKLY